MNLDLHVDIRAIRHLYPELPAGTIRRWASEGALIRRGRAGKRTLYRLGDVVRLIAARRN